MLGKQRNTNIAIVATSPEEAPKAMEEVIQTLQQAAEAVSTGRYPSPPARVLNLVTRGKPTGLTQTFIIWILTEGQAFVPEAGFVQVAPEALSEALDKLR